MGKFLNQELKLRLLGAGILIALVVIFLPMFFSTDNVVKVDTKKKYSNNTVQFIYDKTVNKNATKQISAKKRVVSKAIDGKKQENNQDRYYNWKIQVASFSNENNANRLNKTLDKIGLSVSKTSFKLKDKIMYRIVLGPYESKEAAKRVVEEIKQKQKLQGLEDMRIFKHQN
jgi:cell division septation protein DedD